MHITTMTPAHLPAVHEIIRTLGLTPHGDDDWLHYRVYGNLGATPQTSLVAENDDGEVIGLCIAAAHEGRGVIKLFGVRADARRRGLATALFDELESRFRARGITEVAVIGLPPPYFTPAVDLTHTEAVVFLLRRGYTTDRTAQVDMSVDLGHADLETAAVEQRLSSEGITLRRATMEEVPAVAAFALKTFSVGWYVETSDAARFSPPPLFIALDKGEIVGFAVYDVTGQDRFGPTGTRPDYRKRGIGEALLKMCLRDMRDRGAAVAEIGWAGPLAFYYRAVDARISRVYWSFRKKLE